MEATPRILVLLGKSSILECHFCPAITSSQKKKYVLGLSELLMCNPLLNVDEPKKKFYIGNRVITLPTGNFKVEDIEEYLQKKLSGTNVTLNLKANLGTLKYEIEGNERIDFTPQDSIGRLLGFKPEILEPNISHTSDQLAEISKTKCLSVECNITKCSDMKSEYQHTIYQFFPVVPPRCMIVEQPEFITYFPVAFKNIDYIQLRIVDQDGIPVDLRGGTVRVQLHLKPDSEET
ncbi:hypothetical protein QAD02_023496 [Eretmocerus hayati]|uniref:Uncharacterized protein n=1 Tax=Eretmocerus hayati TaxID=131215 RepID=A0ACC2PZD0_9HYME|nr:hypothetical protein QAD02_023496 [Eretmocerus hayati]